MSYVIETTSIDQPVDNTQSLTKRFVVLSYGILSYALGVAALLWIILAAGDLAPIGLSALHTESVGAALLVDLALVILFGLQHSIMAREGFKKRITKIIPQAAERANYMFMTAVATAIALYFWQPLPGMVWQIENSVAQTILWSLYAAGWLYLFVSTFITNHFELMGLRQVYLYFRNKPYTSLSFTRKYMYRYSRHPMMLGFLIGLWAIPTMSVTHFLMAVLFTGYIGVGMFFEERDLLRKFGDTYRKYKNEIATFVPGLY